MMRSVLLLLFALWTTLSYAADPEEMAQAGIDGHAKATYFAQGGYVFALNVVENGDVYYHMSVGSSHSWFGIGFGSSMTNTRMLISYLAANGANITNTCRMAYGHSEPEHDRDCKIENVATDHYAPFENTISPDGVLIAHAVCRNCSSWLGGALDVHNEQQPFIYALGPNETLHSDDLNAPLRLHSFYGTFTMNMTQATNYTGTYGRVPAPQDPALQVGHAFWAFANYYSSTPYNTGTLADWSPVAHAVFMCLAFVLIFPLGIISLRLLRRAMFHAAAQMVGLVFVLIGFAFGIYAAKLYNKSKHFNSTHQILGLLVFALLFLQIGLGLSHHLLFMRSGVPTMLGKVHRFLGVFIMVLAIVNGGLGFDFAGTSATPYAIVVAIMAAIIGALAVFIYRHNQSTIYKPEDHQVLADYSSGPPGEYEMHNTPMTNMTYVQTPRTPWFPEQQRRVDDPDNYRAHLMRTHRQDSQYTDTPASDIKDLFRSKWEAVPV